jgi:hypothetical protein
MTATACRTGAVVAKYTPSRSLAKTTFAKTGVFQPIAIFVKLRHVKGMAA